MALWTEFAQIADPEAAGIASVMAFEHGIRQRIGGRWEIAVKMAASQEVVLMKSTGTPVQKAGLSLALLTAVREGLPALEARASDKDVGELAELFARVTRRAEHIGLLLEAEENPGPIRQEMRAQLAQTYKLLAENLEFGNAWHRFRSAYWWWNEAEGAGTTGRLTQDIQARARAAWEEARETGDKKTEALLVQWVTHRGWPVPTGDLADD